MPLDQVIETPLMRAQDAPSPAGALADALMARIAARNARIAVIGLGYVGLPLILGFADVGFPVMGLDTDPEKIKTLRAGRSYIKHIASEKIEAVRAAGNFAVGSEPSAVAEVDAIIICVPTPLTKNRDPDLSYVEKTAAAIAPYIKRGQLIILESTTWPGTTREILIPLLETGSGLKSQDDFFVAFSPEREDPGNAEFGTHSIPKVVGGDGSDAARVAQALYSSFISKTVVVSNPDTAEAVKLTENIFRSANIALVNELKMVYDAMGIDVWDVINAAATKPFGFMPFYPGPGLGGHCIPVDPFYLTWKAREHHLSTRFIELAGEIIAFMPSYVVGKLTEALSKRFRKSLTGANILLIGMAYKKNVEDIRESPALRITDMLEAAGAHVTYHDSYIPTIPMTRNHPHYAGRQSIALDADIIAAQDAVLIVTDHDDVDYAQISQHARLIVDTRNAMAAFACENVVKA